MRSRLLLAFCLLLAGAAEAQDLNVITSVEVRAEATGVVVTVKGSKPPNFTTFSMAEPARFVIDLSEARFQGVPEDLRVDDGVIRVVKNLAYGTGANSIARVMLAFSLDVEPPDVQTDGTSLVVKVLRPGAPAVAAAAAPAAPVAAGTPAAAPEAAGAAAATVAAKAELDEAARQEALAKEWREAEARAQARQAAESSAKEREAQARLEAEAASRQAEQAAAEQAAAERTASAAAESRRAEIKAKAAAEEGQAGRAGAAAPAAATAATGTEADARAEAKARQEVEEALAAQREAEARAAPPIQPPPAAPATPPVAAPEASAPAPSLAARPGSPNEPPVRPAKLQSVGFKQLPTVSRVFVKTSETPRFTITDVGDDVVRVEVENTRVSRRNDTRPLDTSFFSSAVAMITPSKQGTSYVVDIKLRKRVPYQQKVEGSLLAIDFERPAAAAVPGQASAAAGTGADEGTLENRQGLIITPEEKPEGAEPVATEPATEPAAKQ